MDDKIKEIISRRKEANLLIIEKIKEIAEKFPDMRFGQILYNYVMKYDHNGQICDPFYEESVDTYKRLKENTDSLELK